MSDDRPSRPTGAGPEPDPESDPDNRPRQASYPGLLRGGPGRGRHSRNALSKKFFADLHDLWDREGRAILARAAFQEPMKFAQMVAGLMPHKLEVDVDPAGEGMSPERLDQLIAFAEQMVARGFEAQQRAADAHDLADLLVGPVAPAEIAGAPTARTTTK